MSKRTLLDIGLVILILAFLLAIIVPSIHKVQQGAHVVQQMAAFGEVCQHIEDYNEPPAAIFNKEIRYDPNAFGHSEKLLFHKEYFGHKVVTYGNGRFILSSGKGKIIRQGDVFANDNDKIFREYTGAEPYIHK
jgi:hypothetical protein